MNQCLMHRFTGIVNKGGSKTVAHGQWLRDAFDHNLGRRVAPVIQRRIKPAYAVNPVVNMDEALAFIFR